MFILVACYLQVFQRADVCDFTCLSSDTRCSAEFSCCSDQVDNFVDSGLAEDLCCDGL